MKILLDQNLSYKLIKSISQKFPGSNHVSNLGLSDANDIDIYKYAREKNYTIVSHDSDFIDLILVKGSPPKLIWINTGNLTTKNVLSILENKFETIFQFINSKEEILEINN